MKLAKVFGITLVTITSIAAFIWLFIVVDESSRVQKAEDAKRKAQYEALYGKKVAVSGNMFTITKVSTIFQTCTVTTPEGKEIDMDVKFCLATAE